MNINNAQKSAINFKSRLQGNEYHMSYSLDYNHNGKKPDKFILSRLQMLSKNPEETVVIDLGAGQGRNSIPIAKKGFNLYSCEICELGRNIIAKEAKSKYVRKNITILNHNILDKLRIGENVDFVFMSHVSQHFKINELKQVFKNVAEVMKEDGEFVFDFLERMKANYKNYDKFPKALKRACRDGSNTMDEIGAASFIREDVIQAAKDAGLKLVKEAPSSKYILGKSKYEKQNIWGGFNILDFLCGIQRRPVKLKWFVFRK